MIPNQTLVRGYFLYGSLLQVDFGSSIEAHRTVVRRGIDEELDAMKQTYDGIDDLLSQTARAIAATVPQQFSIDLNVIFFPQIGFLISMPLDGETGAGTYEGQEDEEGLWEKMFTTGLRVYYKDFRMRQMDETFGDMYAQICGMFSRMPSMICMVNAFRP